MKPKKTSRKTKSKGDATIVELQAQIAARDLNQANIRQHYEAIINHQCLEAEIEAKDAAEAIESCAMQAKQAWARGREFHGRIEKASKALIYRRAELLAEVQRVEDLLESLAPAREHAAQQNAA